MGNVWVVVMMGRLFVGAGIWWWLGFFCGVLNELSFYGINKSILI
jgi:hypothetical protein